MLTKSAPHPSFGLTLQVTNYFFSAPPVTRLPENSKIGDFVCNIVAVDGDKGIGRPIRYILDSR